VGGRGGGQFNLGKKSPSSRGDIAMRGVLGGKESGIGLRGTVALRKNHEKKRRERGSYLKAILEREQHTREEMGRDITVRPHTVDTQMGKRVDSDETHRHEKKKPVQQNKKTDREKGKTRRRGTGRLKKKGLYKMGLLFKNHTL